MPSGEAATARRTAVALPDGARCPTLDPAFGWSGAALLCAKSERGGCGKPSKVSDLPCGGECGMSSGAAPHGIVERIGTRRHQHNADGVEVGLEGDWPL